MNYRGSYRHLLKNGKAAMLAAIEIYNKPRFDYRDECGFILLLNAWELVLKALLSKNGKSIFYPKKRKESYRTLSWIDALKASEPLFPNDVPPLPVRRNLELLATYRDNSVHFYNDRDFGTILYALAQTAIVNFKDLLRLAFQVDLGTEITWQLLPLGLHAPVDPIEYISGAAAGGKKPSAAIRQFILELKSAAQELEDAGADTGRLLTVFSVKLESTKKIQNADVVVGVASPTAAPGPLAVVKTVDPNISHPLRQTEVLERIPTVDGRSLTPYVFQAVAWKYELKSKPQYCWRATEGVLTRYSNDVVSFIKRLTPADIEAALADYRASQKHRAKAGAGR